MVKYNENYREESYDFDDFDEDNLKKVYPILTNSTMI